MAAGRATGGRSASLFRGSASCEDVSRVIDRRHDVQILVFRMSRRRNHRPCGDEYDGDGDDDDDCDRTYSAETMEMPDPRDKPCSLEPTQCPFLLLPLLRHHRGYAMESPPSRFPPFHQSLREEGGKGYPPRVAGGTESRLRGVYESLDWPTYSFSRPCDGTIAAAAEGEEEEEWSSRG